MSANAVDFDRFVNQCQTLCEELWKVNEVTFGEMLFALALIIEELLTLDGCPRAAEVFKTGMAKPMANVTNQTRIDLCIDAITRFGKTLSKEDVDNLQAICALAAEKIAHVGYSEGHGDTIRNLWKHTVKVMLAERPAEDLAKIIPTQTGSVN